MTRWSVSFCANETSCLWLKLHQDIIVYAARLIPFDDEKQDRLIQLLKELMKLCQVGGACPITKHKMY